MSNLISIIPHTGYGAALFPFLDARDLDNLKRTCKILNQDVKAHVDRQGASVPYEHGLFVRKDGNLQVQHEGKLQEEFCLEYTPECSPITKEECNKQLAEQDKPCTERNNTWQGAKQSYNINDDIRRNEIRYRQENGYWGCITVNQEDFGKCFWPKLFRTKAEWEKWNSIQEAMKS